MSRGKKLQIRRLKRLLASQENRSKGNIFIFECGFSALCLPECLGVSPTSDRAQQGWSWVMRDEHIQVIQMEQPQLPAPWKYSPFGIRMS